MTSTWTEITKNGELNGIILLDIRKAFDLVNHEKLLRKLDIYHKLVFLISKRSTSTSVLQRKIPGRTTSEYWSSSRGYTWALNVHTFYP